MDEIGLISQLIFNRIRWSLVFQQKSLGGDLVGRQG